MVHYRYSLTSKIFFTLSVTLLLLFSQNIVTAEEIPLEGQSTSFSTGGWIVQNSSTTENLFGISFIDSNFGTIVGEGGTEMLAQGIENVVDKLYLDKKIELSEGLLDAFVSGAVMSAGVFKSPLIFKQIFNPFRSKDSEIEIARGEQLIKELNEEIAKLDPSIENDKKQIEFLGNAVNDIKAKQIKYLANSLHVKRVSSRQMTARGTFARFQQEPHCRSGSGIMAISVDAESKTQ